MIKIFFKLRKKRGSFKNFPNSGAFGFLIFKRPYYAFNNVDIVLRDAAKYIYLKSVLYANNSHLCLFFLIFSYFITNTCDKVDYTTAKTS